MPYDYKTPPTTSLSLSSITAGTLQVPLNMVRTNTVTAGTTQLVGTSGGPVLNAITGDEAKIQVNGVTGLSISASTNPANGTLLLNPNASNASFIAICAANTADSAAGPMIYMGGGSYSTHPNGDAARNKMLFMMPATSPVGGVAGEFQWWHNKFDPATGGLELMSLVTGGVLSLYKSNTIAASISPANLTASRAFTLPDTAGTLMVSGGSGSVSLSNLTAGTLAVDLSINAANKIDWGTGAGTGTSNSTSTEIVSASSGMIQNVISGKVWDTRIAGTSKFTISGSLCQTKQTLRFNPVVAHISTGTENEIYLDGNSDLCLNTTTNYGLGQLHIKIDGTSQQTFSANGIRLNTGAGSVTAGTRGIYQTSTGLVYNTPTSTDHRLHVNNALISQFSPTAISLGLAPTYASNAAAVNIVTNAAASLFDALAIQGSFTQAASGVSLNGTSSAYASLYAQTNLTDNATRARAYVNGHATIPNVVIETAAITRITVNVANTRVLTGHNFVFGSTGSALATSATDGFIYAPSCAGTPSGVPTAYAGTVPLLVDTTAGKLWAYYGGAWRYTTFA